VELNRNQIFMIGLVLLLFGLQFRMVESYVLNERASTFLAEHAGGGGGEVTSAAVGAKVIKLPEWVGWLMISTGTVMVLHSLVMNKPGG
jgi:hypothetical protein